MDQKPACIRESAVSAKIHPQRLFDFSVNLFILKRATRIDFVAVCRRRKRIRVLWAKPVCTTGNGDEAL